MKQTIKQTREKSARQYWRYMRWFPAIAWMSVIFVLSSRTGDELSTVMPLMQKLFPFMTDFNWGHFVAYFILALTFDYGIGPKAERIGVKLLIILLCGIYGVTDEFHQSFVGGRMPDIIDIRNDMIGAAIWTVLVWIPAVRRGWRKVSGWRSEQ